MRKGVVIDGDGHILEPRDLWQKQLAPEHRGNAIGVEWNAETQHEETLIGDRVVLPRGQVSAGFARRPYIDQGRGVRWEDLPAGGLAPISRLHELDREGIDAAVLYPTQGLVLSCIDDPPDAAAACRVYNDWLSEFCSADPKRLIGAAAVPIQDPEAAAIEARRAVEKLGMRAVFVRVTEYGDTFFCDAAVDRLWAECQDLDVPIGLHPGAFGGSWCASLLYKSHSVPALGQHINFAFDAMYGLTAMVGFGILERFPKLKVAVLESGGGWIPHWIDRVDHFKGVHPKDAAHFPLQPSEYFRRQCTISYDPDEHTLPLMVDVIGEDRIIWATDYPHLDVTAENTVDELVENIAGLPESTREKIMGGNAVKLYGLGS